MNNREIDKAVKDYGYVIPVDLYIKICRSPQVDHVKADGEWTDIWTNDGSHWRVKTFIKGECICQY